MIANSMEAALREMFLRLDKRHGTSLGVGMHPPSETEIKFAERLLEVGGLCRWSRQVEVRTALATFYLDVTATHMDGSSVGLECDGEPFHRDWFRDFCRDTLILQAGAVRAIYRIPARDIIERWHTCVCILSGREPWMFRSLIRRHAVGLVEAIGWREALRQMNGIRLLRKDEGETAESRAMRRIVELAMERTHGETFPAFVERCRKLHMPGERKQP